MRELMSTQRESIQMRKYLPHEFAIAASSKRLIGIRIDRADQNHEMSWGLSLI